MSYDSRKIWLKPTHKTAVLATPELSNRAIAVKPFYFLSFVLGLTLCRFRVVFAVRVCATAAR